MINKDNPLSNYLSATGFWNVFKQIKHIDKTTYLDKYLQGMTINELLKLCEGSNINKEITPEVKAFFERIDKDKITTRYFKTFAL